MFFSAAAIISVVAAVAAAHDITIVNHCDKEITPFVTDAITLAAGAQTTVSVPSGWNGRVCTDGAACAGSKAEFSFDTAGQVFYDVTNLDGFTYPLAISTTCGVVSCATKDCACTQAYGNCGPTGSDADAAVRSCANQDNVAVVVC